jgi:hypothetical protein
VAHQQAFAGFAGNDHRAALAALGDGGGSLEIEIALGVPGIVAGEAVFPEDRQYLERKSTGLSRLNTTTSSPAGCPEALSGSPAGIKFQANIVVSIRYFISSYGNVSFFWRD